MTRRPGAAALALLTVLLLGLTLPAPALAAARDTRLTLIGPSEITLGDRVEVQAIVLDGRGKPVADALVVLNVDKTFEGRTRTDKTGTGRFVVKRDLKVGGHTLQAVYAGDPKHTAAKVSRKLLVNAPNLVIRTLPATPGVVFRFRNRDFTSGPDGVATLELGSPYHQGEVPDVVSVPQSTSGRVAFDRWWGKAPELTAALEQFWTVDFRFTDRLGNPVDESRITKMVLRSSIGQVIELTQPAPMEVQGVRVVSLAGGLEAKDILYGIDEVTIEGSNVVNRAQQRFTPRLSQDWGVEILFYKTSIKLTDTLFGLGISTDLKIQYPGGRIDTVRTDEHGVVSLPPMPRGIYQVTPLKVGVTVVRPVAMSRDADVELAVITYLDIVVVIGAGLLVAVGLLLLGRPGIVRAIHRRLRPKGRATV